MSENNKYEVEDMISSAASQQPIEFEQVFDNLIVSRIQSAINNKKIQVAQQMYGYSPEEETE